MKENKETKIYIRVTRAEKKKIDDQCKAMDYPSLSQYIRDVVLNKKIVTKTDVEMILQLKKIGVNINQIAKQLNTNPSEVVSNDTIRKLDNYMLELKEVTKRII